VSSADVLLEKQTGDGEYDPKSMENHVITVGEVSLGEVHHGGEPVVG